MHVNAKPWDDLEKFEFLNKSVSGAAYQAISTIRVCATNYASARDRIYQRFGRISLAEDQHTEIIFTACKRKDLQQNDKFIAFAALVVQNIESLVMLGNSLEGMSPTLSKPILKALPRDHQLRFSDSWSDEKGECRLKAIVDFLKKEQSALQRITDWNAENDWKSTSQNEKKSNGKNQFKKGKNSKWEHSEASGSKSQYAFAAASQEAKQGCIFCAADHPSTKCKNKLTVEERRKCVVTQNACFKCLGRNHIAKKCRGKSNCGNCGAGHATIICLKPKNKGQSSVAAVASQEENNSNNGPIVCSIATEKIQLSNAAEKSLPTGYVEAWANNRRKICRVVLDTGSQKTFVTKKFADDLGADRIGVDKFNLLSAGNATARRFVSDVVELTLKSRFSENSIIVQATAMKTVINGKLPNVDYRGKLSPIADRNDQGWSTEVDLLIGVDFLHRIVGPSIRRVESLMAFETIFGYFLCGVNRGQTFALDEYSINSIKLKRMSWNPNKDNRSWTTVNSVTVATEKKYEPAGISFLWDTEFMGIEPYSRESDEAGKEELNEFFRKTTQRHPSGRYIISLPFKPNRKTLGSNRKITELRLKGLLIQLKKDSRFLKAVDEEIKNLIAQGFVERTNPPEPGEEAHYLPLLAVKKAGSTPDNLKVRLVNDAGCRMRDEAGLNDVLHQGECLIADIVELILKFRQVKIPICSDIERAYQQFWINPEHRTFLRFLWPLGISENPRAQTQEFWSSRLAFGLVSAPWLHCAGIRHHLEHEMKNYPRHAELLNFVRENFNIDDILGYSNSVEEGKTAVDVLNEIFKAGCFPLNKWSTSSVEVGEYIQAKYPDAVVSFREANHKFLGIRWNQQRDSIHIDVSQAIKLLESCVPSKRTLLRGASTVFDPLSFLIPITLAFKMQLQQLWIKKMDWDTKLEGVEALVFLENARRLKEATAISLERNFALDPAAAALNKIEPHIFCDASLKGYGCVAYARKIYKKPRVEVSFIMAKGRVAPLKGDWSIHRLELLGAVVAVRIANKIKKATLREFDSVNFWCDNACVLAWIRDRPERWKMFVQNRITEIQANSSANQWRYIRTSENPSDLIGRTSALDTDQLRNFWLKGPRWLQSMEDPASHSLNPEEEKFEISNELRAQCVVGTVVSAAALEPIGIKQFSSWTKTLRVVAYMRRWLSYRRKRLTRSVTKVDNSVIKAVEYKPAEIAILKNIHGRYFAKELDSGLEEISRKSVLYNFNPILGKDGLIRCRSRLLKSTEMVTGTTEPIILPGDEDLVDLYLRWLHEKVCFHAGGVVGVLQRVRQKFLILRARRAIKKAIKGCKVCAKFAAQKATEVCPPLPKFRIETVAPWTVSTSK